MTRRFIAFVEDSEAVVGSYRKVFGDKMLLATTLDEFERNLLPRKDEIGIWFLDVDIPRHEGGREEARFGLRVAQILKEECPEVPRICISDFFEEQIRQFYNRHIKKRDIRAIAEAAAEVGL